MKGISMEIIIKGNSADIEINGGDISGKFISSPNGKYHLLCGTFWTKSGNDIESVVVFTDIEILYKKAAEIDDLKLCRVNDDGSCVYVSDGDRIVMLDASGKQVTSKKTPTIETAGYHNEYFWAFGNNDNGDFVIMVFNPQNKDGGTKKLPVVEVPDPEDEEEVIELEPTDIALIDDHIIIGYEDGDACVAYDFNLQVVEPSENERSVVSEVQKERLKREAEARERAKAEREAYLAKKAQAAAEQKKCNNPASVFVGATMQKKPLKSHNVFFSVLSKLFKK